MTIDHFRHALCARRYAFSHKRLPFAFLKSVQIRGCFRADPCATAFSQSTTTNRTLAWTVRSVGARYP